MAEKIYLVLENGKVFTGKSFGKIGETKGELVFTTAMTGYLETLTDPSYFGQIVIQTFPLIGNYGVIPQDFESERPHLQGYIVRDWCNTPSNFRSESDIDSFLKKENIVGLYDIDTRCLTRIIREQGVMRAKITQNIDDIEGIIAELKAFTIENSVETVSTSEVVTLKSDHTKHKVVLWDFGAKGNISKELLKRGCDVTIVPYNTSAAAILAMSPDGIMLSNGPGNPADNVGIISELAKICEKKIPIFGICLGHQLLALSQGGKTEKLKYGHRGANQPVVRLEDGAVYISTQNHGYAVVTESLPESAKVSYVNGNDNTCEGVDYLNMPAFSSQFHPEASAGPLDTMFMFDKFIKMME